MNRVFVNGLGAVSPAGWGVGAFWEALIRGEPLPAQDVVRPGWTWPLSIRRVPAPVQRPNFAGHARLRRASAISQFALGAGIEALGSAPRSAEFRLGVVFCVMAGSVVYSRRFFEEVLRDPATASPVLFPETVYNAPASHLSAFLGSTAWNYTLVGDAGVFLQGVGLAAEWLGRGELDGCLVVGAEEADWLPADAFRRFDRRLPLAEGAGAVFVSGQSQGAMAELTGIASPRIFFNRRTRIAAARAVWSELTVGPGAWICSGWAGDSQHDAAEGVISGGAARLATKRVLGEGLGASGAWQCLGACAAVARRRAETAAVLTIGLNEQVVGATFRAVDSSP
jgi:3-oxoacyl-(acyl-carrier-protein) synthase